MRPSRLELTDGAPSPAPPTSRRQRLGVGRLRAGAEPRPPSRKRKGDLAEQVYRRLKDLILRYRFRPGQRLVSQELAARFKVSRTPVNHALARLEQEGYIWSKPNRGYTIAEIEPEEAGELYDLREALESFAVGRAVERQSPARMREIRRRMMEYSRLGREPLSRQKLLLDRTFHTAIARMAGNKRLMEMLDQVFERVILKRTIEGLVSRGELTAREHEGIYEAIRARNAALAVQRMRQHIQNSRTNLLEHLQAMRGLSRGAARRGRA